MREAVRRGLLVIRRQQVRHTGATSHVLRAVGSLRRHDHGLSEHLVREVLQVGVLREVLLVLVLDGEVEIAEVIERAPSEQLHLEAPNNADAHVLTRVCHDSTSQLVRLHLHESLLVEAEISEEFGVLFEVFGRRLSWHAGKVLRLLLWQVGQDALMFKQATLRDEHAHVVEQREVHQLPVDDLEHLALSGNNQVSVVPIVDLVVEGIGAWILDLKVLGRDEQAAQ